MDAIYKKDVVIFNNNFYEQEIMQVLGSKYDLSHIHLKLSLVHVLLKSIGGGGEGSIYSGTLKMVFIVSYSTKILYCTFQFIVPIYVS